MKRRWRALLAVCVVSLWSPAAMGVCIGVDCDGDGLLNDEDVCPSLAESENKGFFHHGFQDFACYETMINPSITVGLVKVFDENCVPVAARRIADELPQQALKPSQGTGKVSGVIFVGLAKYNESLWTNNFDLPASFEAADAAAVRAAFVQGKAPADALFGCVGSVMFDPVTHQLDPTQTRVVYGYKIAASYVRAILQGAPANGYKPDGLGLFRAVRKGSPLWKNGIAGTVGTWWDDSEWSTTSDILWNGPSSALPRMLTSYVDETCYAERLETQEAWVKEQEKKFTPPKNKKPWEVIPDPAPEDSVKSWTSKYKSLKQYEASADGRVAKVRTSVFGTRPLVTDLPAMEKQQVIFQKKELPVKGTLPPKKEFQAKVAEVVQLPGKNLKGPPLKAAKFEPDPGEYKLPGSMEYVPWEPGCTETALSDPVKCCSRKTDALVFKPKELKGDFADGMDTWVDFFGGKPPEMMPRALDDWAGTVGGDVPLHKAIQAALKGSAALAPTWPLTNALSAQAVKLGLGPTCKQVDLGTSLSGGMLVKTPFAAGKDWQFFSGAFHSVLSKSGLGLADRPLRNVWETPLSGGFRALSVKPFGYVSCFQVWDDAGQKWKGPTSFLPSNSVDFGEVIAPEAAWTPTTAMNFVAHKNLVASKHRTQSKWYPGADRWDTNYPLQKVADAKRIPPGYIGSFFSSSKIQENENNDVATTLLQNQFSQVDKATELVNSYNARRDACLKYDPDTISHHWPNFPSASPDGKTVLTGLYGHMRDGTPNVDFPSGDYVGNLGPDSFMHEGLDLDWQGFTKEFLEPVDPVAQNKWNLIESGNSGEDYCYGQLQILEYLDDTIFDGLNTFLPKEEEIGLIANDYQMPMKCTDPSFDYCGELAQIKEEDKDVPFEVMKNSGCDITELAEERIRKDCTSCFENCIKDCTWYDAPWCHPYCTGACGYDLTVGCVYGTLRATIGLGLDAALGGICPLVYGEQCLGMGMKLYKGQRTLADQKINVEIEHRTTFRKIDGKNFPEDKNWVFDTAFSLSYDEYDQWNSFVNSQGKKVVISKENFLPSPGEEFPFTFAPGIMFDRRRIHLSSKEIDGSGGVRIFPGVENYVKNVNEQIEKKNIFTDAGFRVEFAGDFILDCGHEPLHPEIHPPTAIMMHASVPTLDMINFKHYSIFSYSRVYDDKHNSEFDLWPGVRPEGAKEPMFEFLSPTSPKMKNDLVCKPYPQETPNRVRCVLSATSDQPGELCTYNHRFLPSCATAVGGGLIRVGWK